VEDKLTDQLLEPWEVLESVKEMQGKDWLTKERNIHTFFFFLRMGGGFPGIQSSLLFTHFMVLSMAIVNYHGM
jgi:hypothetical protein